jgi:hypothetical protein
MYSNYIDVEDDKILIYSKKEYEIKCKNIPAYKINKENIVLNIL